MIKPRNCAICNILLNDKNGYIKLVRGKEYYGSYCRKCDNKKRHDLSETVSDFKKKYSKEEYKAFINSHDKLNPAIYLNYLESKHASI